MTSETTVTDGISGTAGAPAAARNSAGAGARATAPARPTAGPLAAQGAAPAVLVVQHEEDAGPGLVGECLVRAGLRLDVVRAWRGEPLPEGLGGHAGLLVLGGSVNCEADEAAPWLPRVRTLVREAVSREVPLLGICLGGQIVAHALGGSVVTRARGPELGAVPLRRLPAAEGDPVLGAVPEGALAAQWHWDEVDRLPPGAVPLLTGDDCPYQAFRVGSAGWGLQFHPEVGAGTVARWAEADHAQVRAEGVDPEAVVTSVREAEAELRTVWGAVSEAWGAVVRAHAVAHRSRA
ncbi:type 1 glutamine amidotransferase [Streptomyces sp. NBC_00094]|uniref:type 1 glutamine amidotransferase n=1 Tax=Streptomyces sp. NBC_00094 TaxID=2903620 RepID=UPI002251FEFD|nr:type 1 glutamine amidotransferase [Streptomyces sp. NBC_00094]MCX5388677.1 type 1 glutamine amidotransferase [Streptomyces sp. NBC_00094]